MWLYFVQAAGGPIKIGIADDVRARVGALQVGNHERLAVLAAIPGDRAVEAEWHARFAADRIRGEWFRGTAALVAAIKRAAGDVASVPSAYEEAMGALKALIGATTIDIDAPGQGDRVEILLAEARRTQRLCELTGHADFQSSGVDTLNHGDFAEPPPCATGRVAMAWQADSSPPPTTFGDALDASLALGGSR